jgi:hypothetical protein
MMDDEARKRAIADTVKRANTAPATRVTPNGAVEDTIARAKRVPKLKGKEQEDAGFWGSMIGGLPQAGDMDVKTNLAFPLNILGAIDTLRNRDERTGVSTDLTTAATTALDTMSIGTSDETRGVIDAILAPKGDTTPFIQSAQEAMDMRKLEQVEMREDNPLAAVAGDIGGSAVSGSVLAKGGFNLVAKYLPSAAKAIGATWYGRSAFGAGAGAAETFAYTMNKDGSLEKAAKNAGLAFMGGIVLERGLAGLGKGYQFLRNVKTPDAIAEGVAKQIVDNINIDRAKQGLPAATATDIQTQIDALGKDATLLDVYPKLKQFAQYVLKNEDSLYTGRGLMDMLATRKDIMTEIMSEDGVLTDVLQAPSLRSPKTFEAEVAKRHKVLVPRYTEALDAITDTFDPKVLKKSLDDLLGDKASRPLQTQAVFDFVARQLDAAAKQGKKRGANVPKEISAKQVFSILKTLDKGVSVTDLKMADGMPSGVKAANKEDWVDTSIVRSYLRETLGNVSEDLKKLNKVYGYQADTLKSYKAGAAMLTDSKTSPADILRFMANPAKSKGDLRAFAEGAKYKLFDKLMAVSDEVGLERALTDNKKITGKLRAIMGDEAVDAMLASLKPMLEKSKLAKDLMEVVPKMQTPDPSKGTFTKALDLAIAAGGVPGVTSKAGAFGALGRTIGQKAGVPEGPAERTMYSEVLSQMGDGATASFKKMDDLLKRAIKPTGMSQVGRTGAAAAITGSQFPPE